MDRVKMVHELVNRPGRTKVRIFNGVTSFKVCFWKKGKRWFLDTDLYQFSDLDYTEAGQKRLKELVVNSQFSDGINLEGQSKRVFQISIANDFKDGLEHTVSVWLGIIDKVLANKDFVVKI